MKHLIAERRKAVASNSSGSGSAVSPAAATAGDTTYADRSRKIRESFEQLRALLGQQAQERHRDWEFLQQTLTPVQLGRFLRWTQMFGPVCIKINT